MSAFNKLIEIFCFKLFSKKYIRNYLSPWRLYLLEHLTCHGSIAFADPVQFLQHWCTRGGLPLDLAAAHISWIFSLLQRNLWFSLIFLQTEMHAGYTRNKHRQLMYITHKKTLNKINVIVFIHHKLYSYIFMHDAELTSKTIIGSSSAPFLPGTIKAGW